MANGLLTTWMTGRTILIGQRREKIRQQLVNFDPVILCYLGLYLLIVLKLAYFNDSGDIIVMGRTQQGTFVALFICDIILLLLLLSFLTSSKIS